MATSQNRILWWALVASVLLYTIVAHVAGVPGRPEVPVRTLALVFAIASAGVAAGSLIYRRRALAEPIRSGALDPGTPEGRARAFTPFILNLVLSESVGIYGLALSLLSGEAAYSIPFSAAALFLLFLHRPTAPDLVPPLSGRHRIDDSRPIA